MQLRHALPALFAWSFMVAGGAVAQAAQADRDRGGPAKSDRVDQKGNQDKGERGKGQAKKKVQKHASGKGALGEKIRKNGKHEVGKFKNRTVTADVDNGKVRNMDAGDVPAKRVKTQEKMASLGGISVASNGGLHFVQYGTWYYGYCFDDGYDIECYWYPEEEVYWQEYDWEDYDYYYY
jgi:hypothetical protein